jgi:TatD DNase family protein
MDDLLLAGLVDTHAHLSYLGERGISAVDCLRDLIDAGFAGLLDIGTTVDDLAPRLRSFRRFAGAGDGFSLKFSTGLWPSREAIAGRRELVPRLERNMEAADTAALQLIAAIGECGFDRRENTDVSDGERELFEMQLDLAERKGLPVIVHSREAYAETLHSVTARPGVRGIIHCFSYGPEEARAFLDCGYYISFAGNLTFKNAGNLRDAVTVVPDDRLLLETDCPYLAPVPHRGKPAHPGMVCETFKAAALCRHTEIAALAAQVRVNARLLLGL